MNAKKKATIAGGVIIAIAVVSGAIIAVAPHDKFKANTIIYGVDVGHLNPKMAANTINNEAKVVITDRNGKDYSFPLKNTIHISASDLKPQLNKKNGVDKTQSVLFKKVNMKALTDEVHKGNFASSSTVYTPGRIELKGNKFVHIKGTEGSKVNENNLVTGIREGISMRHSLKFNTRYYEDIDSGNEKELDTKVDTLNKQLNKSITVKVENHTVKIPQSVITTSVTAQGINAQPISDYLANATKQYGTYGKPQAFKTHSGQTVSFINTSSNSWRVDSNATAVGIVNQMNTNPSKDITVDASLTGKRFNDSQFGGTYAEVDLNTQHAYIFEKGKVAVDWPVITGLPNPDNMTNTGIEEVLYKQSPAVLRGTNNDGSPYASPVNYWAPINTEGEGFHDAPWQTQGFGSDLYKTVGSHGCINTSPADMPNVFAHLYTGMPVVVWGDIYK